MQVNKPLITGHKGFIGKALSSKFDSFIGVGQSFMDKEDWEYELGELVKSCDIVFHIGAISDTSVKNYNEVFKYNYYFSKILFELANELKKKVIYSSSAAVYGTDGIPNTLYSWSKLIAEEYGMEVCKRFVSLRYFNVYGPGEEHKSNMASVAYQAWKSGKFKLFPKSPKRDFIYIEDVVNANLCAVDCTKGIYEVGTSQDRTFEEVLDNMEIEYDYHSEDMIPSWYQFNTKADSQDWLPGWSPQYNIEKGLIEYKKYLNKGNLI